MARLNQASGKKPHQGAAKRKSTGAPKRSSPRKSTEGNETKTGDKIVQCCYQGDTVTRNATVAITHSLGALRSTKT